MTTAVMKYEALTEILLPLGDQFEAGNPRGLKLDPSRMEQSEPLRECLAELIAEGWLTQGRLLNHYKLTKEGYQHFEPRLRALRTLGEFGAAPLESHRTRRAHPATRCKN
jgi:hypothetical protein